MKDRNFKVMTWQYLNYLKYRGQKKVDLNVLDFLISLQIKESFFNCTLCCG